MATSMPGTGVMRLETGRVSKRPYPASRKQACTLCRSRKKKCDAAKPTCNYCKKLNLSCTYQDSRSTADGGGNDGDQPPPIISFEGFLNDNSNIQPATDDFTLNSWPWDSILGSYPLQDADLETHEFSKALNDEMLWSGGSSDESGRTPATSSPDNSWFSGSASIGQTPANGASPPPIIVDHNLLVSVIKTFWLSYHPILPCIHKVEFERRIQSFKDEQKTLETAADPLLYAVLAVASQSHMLGEYKPHSDGWISKAKALIELNVKHLTDPINTLQASVWIVFYYFINARMNELWVFVGQAIRLSSFLGFDRLDSSRNISPFGPRTLTALEKETVRQTMWALFLTDRSVSMLTGWPLAIQDEMFKVDYPLLQNDFQNSNFSASTNEPFSPNLPGMIKGSIGLVPPERSPPRLVYKASVLLGQIVTFHISIYNDPTSASYKQRFKELEAGLQTFSLACNKDSRCVATVSEEYVQQFIWLQIMIQICTILLYHPTAGSSTTVMQPIDGGTSREKSPGLARCLNAMQTIVKIAREAASRAVMPLLNPFLFPAWFLSARFLAIAWHDTKDPAYKQNIDFMMMLVDRNSQRWGPLTVKYKTSMMNDFQLDSEALQKIRVGSGAYLGEDCVIGLAVTPAAII